MIEIDPPEITVRDFGSLNGTFINGIKIGQRCKEMSAELARQETYKECQLVSGDILTLGADCALKVDVSASKPDKTSIMAK